LLYANKGQPTPHLDGIKLLDPCDGGIDKFDRFDFALAYKFGLGSSIERGEFVSHRFLLLGFLLPPRIRNSLLMHQRSESEHGRLRRSSTDSIQTWFAVKVMKEE
jgi:hypothetical protein